MSENIREVILEFAQGLPQKSNINTNELIGQFLDKTYLDAKALCASLKNKDHSPMNFCANWIVILKRLNIATIEGMEVLEKLTQEDVTQKDIDQILWNFEVNINRIQDQLAGFSDSLCVLPK